MDLLTYEQVQEILSVQLDEGGTFGEIAERLHDIHPEDVEFAWASQYRELTGVTDIRGVEIAPETIAEFSRRQAWQFRLLPIACSESELVIATTVEHLARALRFVTRTVDRPCSFVITEPVWLGDALQAHYPMPGVSLSSVS
jgi:hypothetical protein